MACLAGDEDRRVAVADHPALPPAARDAVAADPSPWVRSRALLRQDLPEDRRRELHAALVAEQETSDEAWGALEALAHEVVDWVATLPLADRLRHLDSPIPCFRRSAARSDLPPEVVARLHDHADVEVRRTAARHPATPGHVLERLVTEHGENPKRWPAHVEHPNFPPEAFARLADAPDPHRRVLALRGPDLPAAAVARLVRDPEGFVRRAAARHPNLPAPLLEDLVLDDEPGVVEAAAGNPALPAGTMRVLLDLAGR